MGYEEQIKEIEEELARTKYNKATQKHIGMQKAKLAVLREKETKRSSGGKPGAGYSVRKSGDATVLLVGFPSVGKSTLLNRLTNAQSKVASYEFTTLDVVPGVLEINGARIQLLDIPGMIEGGAAGRGRGREILSVIRNADLIILISAAGHRMPIEKQIGTMREELHEGGIRLDQEPPNVRLYRRETGGMKVEPALRLTKLDADTIKGVLKEFGLFNCELVVREDMDMDRLIDALMRNRVYVPSLTVVNKSDILQEPRKRGRIYISADRGDGIDGLRQAIWDRLGLMRVYMKRIGKEPDMKEPLILREGSTVLDVAGKIHREMGKNIMHARIWGPSARFPGQKVGPDLKLRDRDVVEMHF